MRPSTIRLCGARSVGHTRRLRRRIGRTGAAYRPYHRRGIAPLTAQEVSQFHRFGLKPIIFVLNNDGYLIERVLCKNGDTYYNDLAQWRYHKLPEALGCEGWFTARVNTCGELDEAIKRAETCGTGAYIEVGTDK